MNFNWRAFTIAFVVALVTIIFDIKVGGVAFLTLAGSTIAGLIAGYMVRGYMEGILNGAFPVSLAITAIVVLWVSDLGYGLDKLVGMFPVFFIFSLIGPTVGVIIKRMKDNSLKDYNKPYNSDNAGMDKTVTDSAYTEKQSSKSKKIDIWEAIFIFIVIVIIIAGILEIYIIYLELANLPF